MAESSVACVIPARLSSRRFPAKLLQILEGVPVIQHTIARAAKAESFDEIICFTESPEIKEAVDHLDCKVILTGPARNGTERIARNLRFIKSDLIVNLQGDEPLFPVSELISLCIGLKKKPEWVHIMVYKPLIGSGLLTDTNRVKAVVDNRGLVIDFRRHIDNEELKAGGLTCGIQMGIYGYSRNYLSRYARLGPSEREDSEAHELLRNPFLSPIRAHESEKF